MAQLPRYHIGLIGVVSLVISATAWSETSVPAGYETIAAEHGMPSAVLYAVALTESGKRVTTTGQHRPWPWTLNVAGDGYFYATRLEAWQALRDWLDQGKRSIDIGLMQVNWRYHHERLGDPWQALDPYHNLRVGADILRECYASERDWWASVGCYHAPANPARAEQYRRRVLSRWQRVVDAG